MQIALHLRKRFFSFSISNLVCIVKVIVVRLLVLYKRITKIIAILTRLNLKTQLFVLTGTDHYTKYYS